MLQYQKFYEDPKRHFVTKKNFIEGWGFPKEIGIRDDDLFLDRFLDEMDNLGEIFDYSNEIVHNTLLNQYLYNLINWVRIRTKNTQKEVSNQYKRAVRSGKLKPNSRVLYKFSDGRKEYEVDALLNFEYEGKNYTVMVDFKSNGKDRKDIERFRKTSLYKRLMGEGSVYTVAAQPDYTVPPCDVSDSDLTEFYMPKNVKGFIQEIKEEHLRKSKRETKFNRNVNHKRQHSSHFRAGNT